MLLTLMPVMVARFPPLVDYPNHLARCFILRHLGHDLILQRYYRNVMAAQPNLALDLIIPRLNALVSIWTAGRIFLGLTCMMLVAGCFALHRALHGRWSSWPLLGFLFVYNRLLFWGFLGYLFGLGAALLAAALWISIRDRHWAVRLGCGLVAATGLYLLHLFALGIYGVIIIGLDIGDLVRLRPSGRGIAARMTVAAGQFVPAVFLFLFVSPTSHAASRVEWGSLTRKLTAPFKLLVGYHQRIDMLLPVAVLAIALALLVFGKLRIAPIAKYPLALMAVVSVMMPNELFSSFGADRRIPIALALVGIAALDWRDTGRMLRGVCVLGLVVVVAVRTADIATIWARDQPVYQAIVAALDRLPPGVRLLAAAPVTSGQSPPLDHVDAYAVILHDAFVPSLFAAPEDAGSSVGFTPNFEALRRITPPVVIWPPTLRLLQKLVYAQQFGPFRTSLLARYQTALIIDPASIPAPARPPASCHALAQGQEFVLLSLPCPAS